MSYLAIARKYRPATFAEIVGQDHVTRTLTHAIERDRIHHAFLFCGPRGVGKTTAARALAKALNCEHGPTPEPCGTCRSCVEITQGNSPDLIEIDGASNNSVDDVRELRETVRYAPSGGKKKIYLVDEVHMLSNAAFNALLKTLEEPPPHVVFLFATTEPTKIPDTILSRVLRFDFKRIPARGVVERLADIAEREGATVGPAGLRMIARAAEGSMRDAQSLLDKVISFAGPDVSDEGVAETLGLIDRGILHDVLEALVSGAPEVCLDRIAQVYEHGHELSVFTAELLELVRHATFVALSERARAHVDLPADEIERLLAIVEGVEPDALTRLFEAMLEVHDRVSRASRPRIVLEMAVARLANVRPVVPVGALVAKLEALERRVRHAEAGGRRGGAPGRPPARSKGRAHRTPPLRTGARARGRRERSPRRAAPPADTSDDERWALCCRGWAALAEPPAFLAEGRPRFDRGLPSGRTGRLVIAVESGRQQASAKRELERPEVLAVARTCYGDDVDVVVQTTLASRNPAIAPDLEAAVLDDPGVRQVLAVLDGVLEDIQPADEGEA